MIIQVRTHDDLAAIRQTQESPAWIVDAEGEKQLTRVRVVNFEGTAMIEGDYDPERSYRRPDGRLVLALRNISAIQPCRISFPSRNPVSYHQS